MLIPSYERPYKKDRMPVYRLCEVYDGHLPQAPARVWYEADVNYTGGYCNESRALYSNDGCSLLLYEIVGG